MEKHKDNQPQEENDEHTVTVIGKAKRINLAKNSKASELIAALKSKYKEELKSFSFNNTTSVVLNGKVIKMNKDGELEEDPILTKSSTLSLMPQIAGGDRWLWFDVISNINL